MRLIESPQAQADSGNAMADGAKHSGKQRKETQRLRESSSGSENTVEMDTNGAESGVQPIETLRGMRGTPISYIVNQAPIQVAVGGKDYPIGCSLSYQLPQTSPATSLPVSSSCNKTTRLHVHVAQGARGQADCIREKEHVRRLHTVHILPRALHCYCNNLWLPDAAAAAPKKNKKKGLGSFFKATVDQVAEPQPALEQDQAIALELQSYLQAGPLDAEEDPLKWWRESRKFYPRLSTPHRKLCDQVPASMCGCANVFAECK
ncbi:hypothetical protein KUCAC02_006243 [Chaenocephalus aceratus]|nr:hypothetical protein KUCAC02_006243 [Chaenocephalus aceratus]